MKILHVIPSVSDIHGGPSVAIRTMTRALAQEGVDVHIATTDDDGIGHLNVPLSQPVNDCGVTTWYFRRQTSFYKFSWPLTSWLTQHVADYDLLHIHALFSYPTLPASLMAARHGVPYILRPLGTLNRWGMQNHHRWVKRVSFPLVERKIVAHASLLHYTSESECSEARELGVARPYAIIPIGLDLADISCVRSKAWLERRAPHLAGRQIVLFLSRIDPKKGLDLLLPAFVHLRAQRSDIGLLIAGDGEPSYVSALKHRADALGVAGDVYWAGHLGGEDKQGAFAAVDLFALPSYSENFGIAVVEAMAAGLPVVISDQVGIHREVAAAGAGLVVPCTADAIAVALAQMLDPAVAEMGKKGRELVEQRYSIASMTAMLVAAYAGIVKVKRV